MKKKPRVVFNSSSNVVGGGVKNSALFMAYASDDDLIDFYFVISQEVFEAARKVGFSISRDKIFVLEKSPSKSLGARKRLKQIEQLLNPDVVYTMAGPAYFKFSVPHIMGISNAYITHASFSDYFYGKSRLKGCFKFLSSVYQSCWASKADYHIFQTKTALHRFSKAKKLPSSRVFLVTNAFDEKRAANNHFCESESKADKCSDKKNILCPAAGYPHKGLWLIPHIAAEMKIICGAKFKFWLTLDETSSLYFEIKENAQRLGVSDFVGTVGRYDYHEVSSVYEKADVVFVPSLLETFSATYLEAFSFSKPLVAADKTFAKDVCGDAALYVNPLEFKESADAIASLIGCDDLSLKLVERGKERLSLFGTQRDRYENIVSVIKEVAEREYEASSAVDEPRRDAS